MALPRGPGSSRHGRGLVSGSGKYAKFWKYVLTGRGMTRKTKVRSARRRVKGGSFSSWNDKINTKNLDPWQKEQYYRSKQAVKDMFTPRKRK